MARHARPADRRRTLLLGAAGVLLVGALAGGAIASGAVSSQREAAEHPLAAHSLTGAAAPTADALTLTASAPSSSGQPVTVDFMVRQNGAKTLLPDAGADFTLVVLPDVQNYAWSKHWPTMTAQTEWVVAQAESLNTVFVVQLGDLVDWRRVDHQWQRSSDALGVLEDAGVPFIVIAGNHDFNHARSEAGEFNDWFGPSRFANAAWPEGVEFGGYYGQSLYGPDPDDRGSLNTFVLLEAGGRDYLLLSLEFEPPADAVDWAKRVIAAHPDHAVILATHSFVTVDGSRPEVPERDNGLSPQQLWAQLVFPECRIVMVINGHQHDDDRAEAQRFDANRCGTPVPQLLTDYQDRPNGGDGWLRYYTFRPAQNVVDAYTYSPTLGIYETDADSRFTFPLAQSGIHPAPFAPLSSMTVAPGLAATGYLMGPAPGTIYEWYPATRDSLRTSLGTVALISAR